jgi:hypothetical protein
MGLAFKKFLQVLQKKGYVKKNISQASSVYSSKDFTKAIL